MTELATVDVDDLSAAIIDGCTKHYDFYRDDRGLTKWSVALDLTDEEREMGTFDPMMNTLWPLPDMENWDRNKPDDVKAALDNMTLVHVSEDDGTHPYLALTGGGMDMSWPIARTYVRLGYLPPSTLGKLPEMGSMDFDAPENRAAIDALRQSHSHMADRLTRYMDDLDRLGE